MNSSSHPTDHENDSRLHVVVDGFVQGVGFRMFVLEQARALGLRGWVRNTFDGKVEVTAEGSRAALETLLDKIRQGPRMALVTEVQKEWQAAANEFSDFDVRRTV